MAESPIAIVVHGGAWGIPDQLVEKTANGVKKAAMEGHKCLQSGGSAVEAVIAAVQVLEDDPVFDAGTGSVLNEEGEVEMDAMIMDGSDLSIGAVAGVSSVANPVHLALAVKERTPHAMLIGSGAEKFARSIPHIKCVSPNSLIQPEAIEELKKFKQYKKTVSSLFSHDTVGACAIDKYGNVASATSTGGITAKMKGRVGDSPIVGCGAYADNEIGAASTTGHGESIMRTMLAYSSLSFVRQGLHPDLAAHIALQMMHSRLSRKQNSTLQHESHGGAGVIIIDRLGRVGHAFTTPRMAWASITADGLLEGGVEDKPFVQSKL